MLRLVSCCTLAAALFVAGTARGASGPDFDGDFDVDLKDFAVFEPCVGQNASIDCLAAFDFDFDSDIDVDDYRLLQLRFAGPGMPPGMVLSPGGEFEMGDHQGDGWFDELPVHSVYVNSLYMDIYEVTNQQYANGLNWAFQQELIEDPDTHDGVVYGRGGVTAYCDTTTSSSFSRVTWDGATFAVTAGHEDHPMVEVSWYGAAAYANWLSDMHGRDPSYDLWTWECDFDANGYRLPTEAEWEYGARGGEHDSFYRYPWGDTIDGSMANYQFSGDPYETGPFPWTTPVGYYNGRQIPSGSDMANGYGLYDVAGNVWEWCNDWYGSTYYVLSPYENPRGPANGDNRVIRGGAWGGIEANLPCANRHDRYPDYRQYGHGFRLVLDLD
jgi:formylglycine-generating enzyme required for sulfatase activity